MARITYSGLVTDIRGKVGGTVFQGNKHGNTVKNKPSMVLPGSVDQNSSKARFALAVSSWTTASQATRDNWNAWAIANPQYAKFNPSSMLSGFEVFVRFHVNRFRISLLIVTNPSAGTIPIPVFAPIVEMNGNYGFIRSNPSFGGDDLYWNVYMALNIKSSWNFIGTKPRFVAYSSPSESVFAVPSDFMYKNGGNCYPGDIVFLRIVPFNGGNGQVAASQDFKLIAQPIS